MNSINEKIADLEVARALLHERIKNGLNKKVAKFYADMIADIQAQILKKKNITKNLSKTIADLKKTLATPDLNADFIAIAKDEVKFIQGSYNDLAGFTMFSNVLKPKQIENLLSTTLIEGATLGVWMKGLAKEQQSKLERGLKLGVSLGENNYDLARRIAVALNISKRNATTIAVTGAGAIVSQARQDFFEANDDVIKGYQYLATLDTRTSALCRAYDGLTWDTEYKPIGHKYPFRTPRVNTHFNCRSTIIPILKSWQELGIEGLEELDQGTKSSINGYVPKSLNFNDWLKRQDEATIEKTLGKGRAQLFLDGKITMRDLITQQGRSLDLDQISKRNGDRQYGGGRTFSYKVTSEFKKAIGLKVDRVHGSAHYLYKNHYDMFKNYTEVTQAIQDLLQGFEFKKDSTKKGGVIIGKAISNKKMIDIGINLNDGVIFHSNKKKWDATMKALKRSK
ncbi:MAG: minor capsid protein [Campylobacter sp.]|nr:minor capsid protein [Campylobacter sp.]